MEKLKNIFNMKLYAILYTLLVFVISIHSSAVNADGSGVFYTILLVFQSACLALGLSVCYAVGWKKYLYSNAFVGLYILFNLIVAFVSSVYSSAQVVAAENYSALSFLVMTFISFIFIIALYIPAFIVSVVYMINSDSYTKAERPILKIFFFYLLYNTIFIVTDIIVHGLIFRNVFDYVDIVASIICAIIGVCYSVNYKLKAKPLVQLCVLFSIASCCLPVKVYSTAYQSYASIDLYTSNWFGLLFNIFINAFLIIIMYRYAFTKEIYSDVSEEN